MIEMVYRLYVCGKMWEFDNRIGAIRVARYAEIHAKGHVQVIDGKTNKMIYGEL